MEDEELEGIELETVDSEEGIELPDVEENEEVGEAENAETTETETTADDDKENLKRSVNKERRARKEAEKKYKELEARMAALEEANKTPEKTTLDELIESGVDEDIAKSIANAIDKKKGDNSNLAKELADVKFEASITKKSKEAGFEDIEEYADEIKDLVSKGLSIEQSYYAVTYDKPKSKDTKSEIQRKVEAKMQNNKARKDILGNYNSNQGATSNTTSRVQLSPEEKGIAAMAGLTAEEYAAFKSMDSIRDYNKYKAIKKS